MKKSHDGRKLIGNAVPGQRITAKSVSVRLTPHCQRYIDFIIGYFWDVHRMRIKEVDAVHYAISILRPSDLQVLDQFRVFSAGLGRAKTVRIRPEVSEHLKMCARVRYGEKYKNKQWEMATLAVILCGKSLLSLYASDLTIKFDEEGVPSPYKSRMQRVKKSFRVD